MFKKSGYLETGESLHSKRKTKPP